MLKHILTLICALIVWTNSFSQQTVGLLQNDLSDLDTGYVLFSPISSKTTYLIDKCGKQVHSWTSTYRPHLSVYLLEDGSLLKTGAIGNENFMGGGVIEKYDWDGNLIFSYIISTATEIQHHDIHQMPNGNILAIVWEKKTAQEALEKGKNPNFLGSELSPDKIIEIQPIDKFTYNIVWEWHAWDHMIQRYDSNMANYGLPKDHPELININYIRKIQPDMFHLNSIDYNPALDQILVSSHTFSEIWVIDHSTTSAEAASHSGGNSGKGGDLLYRWGNPFAYNRGTEADQKLFGQHDAKWIEKSNRYEGSIMVFNNGINRLGGINYSSVEIIKPPVNSLGEYNDSLPFRPAKQSWIYSDTIPQNFYSQSISGAQQLINGNILICNGSNGIFFEIDTIGNTHWKYISPVSNNGPVDQGILLPFQNDVFRCTYYPVDFAGFVGRKLKPLAPIELKPLVYICHLKDVGIKENTKHISKSIIHQSSGNIEVTTPFNNYEISVVNMYGQKVFYGKNISQINTVNFKNGIYLLVINTPNGELFTEKIVVENLASDSF